ncbi:MAG: single-stranded DNA-binding protein [Clostridia bacterium]|nr:single-stranded DNA-binding protein [Clostridia bacterium]
MAFNKVILIGNITKDIELKQTPEGVSVASFTVAINRKYRGKDGTQTTDFVNCVVWRKTAEFVAQYFKKGKPILVEGEIQTRSYTDNKGEKRYVTEVIANEVGFVGGKDDNAGDNNGSAYVPEAYSNTEATPKFESISEEDDLPF